MFFAWNKQLEIKGFDGYKGNIIKYVMVNRKNYIVVLIC